VGSASQGGRTIHPSLAMPLIRGYVLVKATKAYERAETAPFSYHPEHKMEGVKLHTTGALFTERKTSFKIKLVAFWDPI